jgi:BASS family bile acid:Na+ symporter
MQRRILWLLVGTYVLAALWPAPGLWLRTATLGRISFSGEALRITVPALLLAFLLFNAGLTVRLGELRGLVRRPLPLAIGLFFNLTLPVIYVVGAIALMRTCHPPEVDELQDMLGGLALIACVPVAGSSTAWTQNTDGDMALSVGLVIFSTLLAPLTGPVSLSCLRPFAIGDYAAGLERLGTASGAVLLVTSVLLPASAGLAAHQLLGRVRATRILPILKPLNLGTLLILNYANAAVALPRLTEDPDSHFLSAAFALAIGLCLTLFSAGRLLALVFHFGRAQGVSLMFGLGMTNNGTGLVLASTALPEYPRIVLPILIYNLIQHLIAGAAQRMLGHHQIARPSRPDERLPKVAGSRQQGLDRSPEHRPEPAT